MRTSFAFLAASVLLASCSAPLKITFAFGRDLDVAATQLSIPPELQDPSGNLRALPCDPPACPTLSGAGAPLLVCTNLVCDPAESTIVLDLGEVDVDAAQGDFRGAINMFTRIEVKSITSRIETNTLNVGTGDVELFFGPAGSTGLEAPGVARIGTHPPLAAGQTGDVDVVLDAAGVEALSSYLVAASPRRVQFFARTKVDLAPNQPLPSGAAHAAVVVNVEARGTVGTR